MNILKNQGIRYQYKRNIQSLKAQSKKDRKDHSSSILAEK